MEYSKIEEREKAPEKGSIAWQSGIVIIVLHGALFCLIRESHMTPYLLSADATALAGQLNAIDKKLK
ncbi:MAG: hypothetical protein WBP54_09400 [Pelodictyon phaeoclathratiforme]